MLLHVPYDEMGNGIRKAHEDSTQPVVCCLYGKTPPVRTRGFVSVSEWGDSFLM